jgi:hypothetical protein
MAQNTIYGVRIALDLEADEVFLTDFSRFLSGLSLVVAEDDFHF